MKVGDKVRVYGEETEIVAIAFDEEGDKIYTVKGSTEDYYEHQIEQMTFKLLESILDLSAEELGKEDKNINATLGYEELIELQELWNARVKLEIRCKLIEQERDAIYSDYQDLGKELAKLQDDGDHIPRID